MKRVIEIEKEYKLPAATAIKRFFKTYPDMEYWKETFEWMLETNADHFDDTLMADGTKNREWCYSLHLDQNEDCTYVCIIERA